MHPTSCRQGNGYFLLALITLVFVGFMYVFSTPYGQGLKVSVAD